MEEMFKNVVFWVVFIYLLFPTIKYIFYFNKNKTKMRAPTSVEAFFLFS